MKQMIMRAQLRKMGNSRAIILSQEIIEKLNIVDGQEIEVSINEESALVLKPTKLKNNKRPPLNLDISTWESQFKLAIKKGELPEKDVFESMLNIFDYSLK